MEIIFKDVTADYEVGPIRSPLVLQSVNMTLKSGSFTAIIGHTGAGKSSLLKAMNGLIIPTAGEVTIGDVVIQPGKNKRSLKKIRKRVGMVFQFPESQLFAETVEKDLCFGPLNFGVPLKEAKEMARNVIELVGLDPQILTKSPFSLSGGQKRRVAIAGILAMEPDILVLDEPGAGLDPRGKKEILTIISELHRKRGMTTILVTHDMDDVALFADDVVVMENGKVVIHDQMREVFANLALLDKLHLDVPEARRLQLKIEHRTGIQLPQVCLTVEELADTLIEAGLA
ncbi:energy-coupling factor transporter ATPase [Bacillus sp. PS06]|uniref:energy-coupling factor transporter ATPase n=1 Tax=Bacillus sp. PS06 TaxID=2764176 RepID=UPI001CD8E58A|nr:energy-coupling factor transporter ATPase [Bacillus sp. PS06]